MPETTTVHEDEQEYQLTPLGHAIAEMLQAHKDALGHWEQIEASRGGWLEEGLVAIVADLDAASASARNALARVREKSEAKGA